MTVEGIRAVLPADLKLGTRLLCLDTVDSTSTYLKTLADRGEPHGTVVLAHEQTGGRGRRERVFVSPAGAGLYCSILFRPCCTPMEAVNMTAWVAVAVCKALERCCGIQAGIKWTNDIIFNDRKLGGILSEMSLRPNGSLNYIVVGVGLNLHQTEEELAVTGLDRIATSLQCEGVKRGVSRTALAAALLTVLDEMDADFPVKRQSWLTQYRANCITLNKQVLVIRGESSRIAQALSVEDDFSLLVRYQNGQEERVSAGEVSVRGLMGQI